MERMEAEQVAMKQLDSGERLLWSGSPRPGGMALAALPLTFMGIVFTGFAAFWIASAMNVSSGSSGDGFPGAIFPLFGVPFLVIGFGMLLGPVWAYRSAKNSVYAVTDKRVLIITGAKTVGVRSFAPEDIGEIVRVETLVCNARMRNWVFVKVITDQDGLFGWGEATLEWHTRSIVAAIEDLSQLLIGEDPTRIEHATLLTAALAARRAR